MQSLSERLAEPFDPSELKFKPQMVKGERALAMGYVDARVVQDRLDEAVGVENWQDEYESLPSGSVVCRLSVNFAKPEEPPRWVVKTDVGSPSEQPDEGDRTKAAFSDALKRAAVKFGVGRYLYRFPAQWVAYDPQKKQMTEKPKLPPQAIPSSHKHCGPNVATQIMGLAKSLAEARKVNQTKVIADLLTRYQYKAEYALVNVENRHATAMMQDLHAAIGTEAKKPRAEPQNERALPKDGKELLERLTTFSDKLFAEKRTDHPRRLLEDVVAWGTKAGYPANVSEWPEPAIKGACEEVKRLTNQAA